MPGTAKVWEQLVDEDLTNNNFEIQDFINAVKVGVRSQMYNRIDYADIYEVANQNYLKRKEKEKIFTEVESRKPKQAEPVNVKAEVEKIRDNLRDW